MTYAHSRAEDGEQRPALCLEQLWGLCSLYMLRGCELPRTTASHDGNLFSGHKDIRGQRHSPARKRVLETSIPRITHSFCYRRAGQSTLQNALL